MDWRLLIQLSAIYIQLGMMMIIVIRRNRSGGSDFAYSYSFLRSVVCRLSVVCHIRAPCLSRSTDLDTIWLVHVGAHCVRWGSLIPGEEEIFDVEPQAKICCCLLMIYADVAPISDFAFYRIPSVLSDPW